MHPPYWLKDYVKLINFEEKFEPTKNIAYKRGNVVKVNFGFNIGSEYGGLHYGVVLDNKNSHNSPVLTVIPLTSVKSTKTIHSNSVDLGNEIYRLLKLKYDTISKTLKDEENEIQDMINMFSTLVTYAHSALDNGKTTDTLNYMNASDQINEKWKAKAMHNIDEQMYLQKVGEEISRMKEGSIALINQITTVSKMRIFDPCNLKGVLSGVSLSKESMKKINQKVKDLYIF